LEKNKSSGVRSYVSPSRKALVFQSSTRFGGFLLGMRFSPLLEISHEMSMLQVIINIYDLMTTIQNEFDASHGRPHKTL
jgi:hypothetical protein